MKRKRWGREKRREEEVALPCESQFLERQNAFSLLYKHTSVLTLNFAICILESMKGDLSNGIYGILSVAFGVMEVF